MAYGLGLGPMDLDAIIDGGGGGGSVVTRPQYLPPIEVSAPDPFAVRPQVKITTTTGMTAPTSFPFPSPLGVPWPVLAGLAAFVVYMATQKR